LDERWKGFFPKNNLMRSSCQDSLRVVKKIVVKFWHDHCFMWAGALTYVSILALVPITTVSFSILGHFKLSEANIRTLLLKYFLPESNLVPIIQGNIEKFAQNATTLGIISTIALLLISFAVLCAIEAAFNLIWRVQKKRTYFNKFISFWTVLTLTPLLLGSSLGYIAKFEHLSFSPLIISFVLSTIGLLFLYRLFPYSDVTLKAAFIGSAVASILFEALKWGFKYYINYYAGFGRIYGALSVIPIFLVWLYWVWIIVLLGAEIAFICDYPYTLSHDKFLQYNPMWPVIILLKLMNRFQKDKKCLTSKDLSKELHLSLETINFLTDQLMRHGWIIRSEKETWVPNYPLENLSLREVVSINKGFHKVDCVSMEKLEKLWHELEAFLKKEWDSITLGSLMKHDGVLHKSSA